MMQVSAADMREFAKYDHDQSSFLDMAEFIAALKADRFNKQVSVLIRRHTAFSPYVAPRFPHMPEINYLFSFF